MSIEPLSATLNWRLLPGSHAFPGPDGGTCINEAAIVVAGFPYRPIRRVEDLPFCFSRPISYLALWLNDRMADHQRQRLLPFVTRLAGTRDALDVETQRTRMITAAICHRIYPRMLALHPYLLPSWVYLRECEFHERAAGSMPGAIVKDCLDYIGNNMGRAETLPEADSEFWLTLLDGALKIGKQAAPIETAAIVERVDRVKRAGALPQRVATQADESAPA